MTMTDLNEFSTECVQFAREFFLRFGDEHSFCVTDRLWIMEKLDGCFPLPFLVAVVQRPDCHVCFYTYQEEKSCLFLDCLLEPIEAYTGLNAFNFHFSGDRIKYFVHPLIVVWNGKVLFDRRDQ